MTEKQVLEKLKLFIFLFICFSSSIFMTQSQTGRLSVFSLQLYLISLQGISPLFQFKTELLFFFLDYDFRNAKIRPDLIVDFCGYSLLSIFPFF